MFDIERMFYIFNVGTRGQQAYRTRLTFYLATFIDSYDIINSAICSSVILNRHMSLVFY